MTKHLLTTTAATALLALTGSAHAKMIGDADVRLLPPPMAVYATTAPIKPWGLVFSDMVGSGTIQQFGYSQDPFIDYPSLRGITPYIVIKSLSTAYPSIVYDTLTTPSTCVEFEMGYMDPTNHLSGYLIAAAGSETRSFTFDGNQFSRKFGTQELKTSNHVRVTTSTPFNQLRWTVRNSTFEYARLPQPKTCN